jgi:hypothetical protein
LLVDLADGLAILLEFNEQEMSRHQLPNRPHLDCERLTNVLRRLKAWRLPQLTMGYFGEFDRMEASPTEFIARKNPIWWNSLGEVGIL